MALDDSQEAAIKKQLADAEAEAEKWKKFSRQHEDRAKENAEAAKELEQLKATSLTDQQRRSAEEKKRDDELADLKKRMADADARALRAEVAAAKGLTPAQAKRLSGETREDLEADADDLLANFPSAAKGDDGASGTETNRPRPATRPKTEVSGGGNPTEPAAVETDPAKLAESVPRY